MAFTKNFKLNVRTIKYYVMSVQYYVRWILFNHAKHSGRRKTLYMTIFRSKLSFFPSTSILTVLLQSSTHDFSIQQTGSSSQVMLKTMIEKKRYYTIGNVICYFELRQYTYTTEYERKVLTYLTERWSKNYPELIGRNN